MSAPMSAFTGGGFAGAPGAGGSHYAGQVLGPAVGMQAVGGLITHGGRTTGQPETAFNAPVMHGMSVAPGSAPAVSLPIGHQAYEGLVQLIKVVFQEQLAELGSFYYSIAPPVATNQKAFMMVEREYGKMLPEPLPELATPPLLYMRKRMRRAAMQRFGIAMAFELGFLQTAIGREDLAHQLDNGQNAIRIGSWRLILETALNGAAHWYANLMGWSDGRHHDTAAAFFNRAHHYFGIANEVERGFHMLIADARRIMSDQMITPRMAVVPAGTILQIRATNESETRWWQSGDKTPINGLQPGAAGELSISLGPGFSVHENLRFQINHGTQRVRDNLIQTTQIGGHNFIINPCRGSANARLFNPNHMTSLVYDVARDDWVPISFEHASRYAQIDELKMTPGSMFYNSATRSPYETIGDLVHEADGSDRAIFKGYLKDAGLTLASVMGDNALAGQGTDLPATGMVEEDTATTAASAVRANPYGMFGVTKLPEKQVDVKTLPVVHAFAKALGIKDFKAYTDGVYRELALLEPTARHTTADMEAWKTAHPEAAERMAEDVAAEEEEEAAASLGRTGGLGVDFGSGGGGGGGGGAAAAAAAAVSASTSGVPAALTAARDAFFDPGDVSRSAALNTAIAAFVAKARTDSTLPSRASTGVVTAQSLGKLGAAGGMLLPATVAGTYSRAMRTLAAVSLMPQAKAAMLGAVLDANDTAAMTAPAEDVNARKAYVDHVYAYAMEREVGGISDALAARTLLKLVLLAMVVEPADVADKEGKQGYTQGVANNTTRLYKMIHKYRLRTKDGKAKGPVSLGISGAPAERGFDAFQLYGAVREGALAATGVYTDPMNVYRALIAAAPVSAETFAGLVESGVMPPIGFVMHRPWRQYLMGAVLIVNPGSQYMELAYGSLNTLSGLDVATKSILVNFTGDWAALLKDPRHGMVVPNVFGIEYQCGENTDFFRDAADLAAQIGREHRDASIFVRVIPYVAEAIDLPNPFYLRGEAPAGMFHGIPVPRDVREHNKRAISQRHSNMAKRSVVTNDELLQYTATTAVWGLGIVNQAGTVYYDARAHVGDDLAYSLLDPVDESRPEATWGDHQLNWDHNSGDFSVAVKAKAGWRYAGPGARELREQGASAPVPARPLRVDIAPNPYR